MRLYGALIRFLRIAIHLYFVDVRASGLEHLPADGPVILAANHPSSILDAVLLSTQAPRPIRYLARSGLFRFPLIATLFRRLGAIPVYRPGESADHAERNRIIFDRVYERLEAGDCIGIFPEGRNSPWAQVGPLRKGVARMALGVEARNDYALGLVIVPVGVNLDRRELFMSDALLRFGRPIRVDDYADRHREDPERAVRELTDDVQQALRRQSAHIDDLRVERLVENLAEAFGDELGAELTSEDASIGAEKRESWFRRTVWRLLSWYHRSSEASARSLERRMASRQHISDVLCRAVREQPLAVLRLRRHLERYMDHLGQNRLRKSLGHSFEQPARERWIRLRMTVFAVVMAPVALFGLVHNAVPYLVTQYLPRLFRDEAIRAFAYFGIGVIAFAATYGGIGYWLFRSTDMGMAWILAYLAALPPTGFAALGYRRGILVYRERVLVRTAVFDQAQLGALLRGERARLLERFQELAGRYPPVDD